MNLYIKAIVFFFLMPVLAIGQIGQKDWVLDNSKSLSADQADAFSVLPTQYIRADISIDGFDKKIIKNIQEIVLPHPDGGFKTYVIEPSDVNAPNVAHLYTIKTFTGYLKKDPSVKIACDISSAGFNAAVYAHGGTYFISPANINPSPKHIIYYKNDLQVDKKGCQVRAIENTIDKVIDQKRLLPTQKRTYRLAVSASGEYSQHFGGTPYNVTAVLNAIASGINLINPIYLRDLGIEFSNVTDASIVFQNPNTDPYFKPANAQFDWDGHTIDQLANTLANNFGNSKFDVGHLVIWEDVGGLAGPNPCDDSSKAGGYSGAEGSVSTLWIDFVAHEIGHQFGMPHNFSNSCDGNGEANFRYEPGEGSSIMAYANVCGIGYAQASDPFFAITSINEAQSFINGHNCPTTSSAGNSSDPVITQPANITVPKETPFILVGAATDASDPIANLTYAWEQNDGDGPATTGMPTGNLSKEPLFRFRPASSNNFRHFPVFSSSLSGTNLSPWERPSSVARTINFSLTVRDNNSSFGRLSEANNTVTVANTGPFNVTAPNGGESLSASTMVTWSVNGTAAHCGSVDILISLDGGTTFTIVSDATPNDGSETITLPGSNVTTARILVRCDVAGGFRAASTFYDVSDANFSISSGGNGCNANETVSTATTTGNTLASAMISTQGVVEANGAVFSAPMVNLNSNFSVPAGQCFEINNIGCAYTGTLDCGGGGSQGSGSGTCASPFNLMCGTPFNGNTSNGTNTWSGYPNGSDYPASETIHIITIPANTARTITLTSAVDMDLFISTASCDNSPEYEGINDGNESVAIPAQASAMTYYVVVDGWDGVSGAYTLSCN